MKPGRPTLAAALLMALLPLAGAVAGGNQLAARDDSAPKHDAAGTDRPSHNPHWAFVPVQDETPPPASDWSNHPIDRFVQAKLRQQELAPIKPADRRTLLRRVSFDLIGLPPTPQEVEQFVQDSSDRAWEQVIERFLSSPRYGERWGRHWLDVVRYADTAGDNADYPIPEARLYRDYVIDAFNTDKPYDEFVQEQLAGDLLARQGPREKYAERVIATTFLALSRRYATAPFELMHLTIEDSIETTGRAFMGLTLRCARCHDHKYDPVTKEDYYALYGLFESTRYPYAGSEEFQSKNFDRSGFVPLLPSEEAEPQVEAWKQRIQQLEAKVKQIEEGSASGKRLATLKAEIEARTKAIKAVEEQGQSTETANQELAGLKQERDKAESELKKELTPLRDELKKLKRLGLPAELPCAYAVADAKPVDSCLQVRGEPAEKGPVVKRGVPRFLCAVGTLDIPEGASGRLEFAQWLTSPRHPLTARVMVNRIWQHHFGKGIVATPSNFGLRGDEPSHPELLDYLAARLVESGWSIKAMHRLILSAKTYQLASDWDEDNARRDESNRYYWRFDRRRLDAEAIRDSMMHLAGTLDLARPGPHPFPGVEKWNWTQHSPFKAVYESNHRSVYLMTQRIQRHPYLSLFDAPDANTSTEVRT
ncbi:MAG: DUF1549 domain-containing protein, partial [Verrucomicrobiales bacterium]|nr:DUF1549 domain-containing protein [Verrucomicrobiales bacterium]